MVPGRVARSGIQQYLASELGLSDRAPNDVINVYRPDDEVFNVDSLASYDASDVTLEHPGELVNTENYKATSVGVVQGSAVQDGDFVLANLIIKSKNAITAVDSGKVQLSAGYTAVYEAEAGVTSDGQNYEFVQRDIKINHIAICDRARAGAQARLYDNNGVTPMIKVMLDSGHTLEVADEAGAKLVTDAMKDMAQKVTDAETLVEQANATRDAAVEELEAEKLKTSDTAIAERVEAIAKTKSQAVKIVGDTFTCDSVDTLVIQRAALTAKRPKTEWADKSDVYVQASFDAAFEDAEAQPAATSTADQLAQFAKDAAGLEQGDKKPKLTRDQAYSKELSSKWEK